VLSTYGPPWCGPCRQLTPLLGDGRSRAKGRVKLVKMTLDGIPRFPGQMGHPVDPAVIAFVNGQAADGLSWARCRKARSTPHRQADPRACRRAGEPNIADILQGSRAVLAEGDAAGAAQIYAEGCAHDFHQYRGARQGSRNVVTTGAIAPAQANQKCHGFRSPSQTTPRWGGEKTGRPQIASRKNSAKAVATLTEWNKSRPQPADHQARGFDWRPQLNAQGKRSRRPSN